MLFSNGRDKRKPAQRCNDYRENEPHSNSSGCARFAYCSQHALLTYGKHHAELCQQTRVVVATRAQRQAQHGIRL